MKIKDLAAPFPRDAIHWRAQTLTRKKDKALALAYLDARDVMDRLDEVCGAENWSTTYHETATGRVLCSLAIRIGDQWVTKTDGAGNTAVEGEKGGISDALKRAAVQWGVGRYLYNLNNVWAPCEVNDRQQWKAWTADAPSIFNKALATVEPAETITEAQREKLSEYLRSLSFPTDRFLSVSKIKDLRELPAAKFDGAMKWIADEAKKMETQNA